LEGLSGTESKRKSSRTWTISMGIFQILLRKFYSGTEENPSDLST
jgi:hypothetical protein